jgi:hypothetical protein
LTATAAHGGKPGESFEAANATVTDNRPTAIVVVGHGGTTLASWQASPGRGGSGGGSGGGGSSWTCTHHPFDQASESGSSLGIDYETLAYPLEEGGAYAFVCRDEGGAVVHSAFMIYDPADVLGDLAAEPRAIDAALASLDLPTPTIATSPATDLLVGLDTWLWVDTAWAGTGATAQVGATAATVTATPVRVHWDLGDGTTLTCDGPGTPYRAGTTPTCAHTYRYRSTVDDPHGTYTVTATVDWQAAYSTTLGGAGDLGALTTTATTTVRVLEAQSVIHYD